jgi:hypothetical protein
MEPPIRDRRCYRRWLKAAPVCTSHRIGRGLLSGPTEVHHKTMRCRRDRRHLCGKATPIGHEPRMCHTNLRCFQLRLDADFESLAHENRPILRVLAKPEFGGMLLRVFQSLESGSPNPRITDTHLRGYDRYQPGWIAARIGCLVAAVEIVRILRHRQPAIEIAKKTIEGYPGAWQLVNECRRLQSQSPCQFQSQNSCQLDRRLSC